MAKYKKKPVIIEAIQWTGENNKEIEDFLGENLYGYSDSLDHNKLMYIKTLEGTIVASINDYIIMGVHGEFYPCKPDIFQETYE